MNYSAIFVSIIVSKFSLPFVLGREGEDRTGALLADREAVLYEISSKEAEFSKKDALLEKDKARASAEAQQKVCAFYVFFSPSALACSKHFVCACVIIDCVSRIFNFFAAK